MMASANPERTVLAVRWTAVVPVANAPPSAAAALLTVGANNVAQTDAATAAGHAEISRAAKPVSVLTPPPVGMASARLTRAAPAAKRIAPAASPRSALQPEPAAHQAAPTKPAAATVAVANVASARLARSATSSSA